MLSAIQKTEIAAAGLIEEQVEKLLVRANQEIQSGLLPTAQIALARNGKVVIFEHFGRAQPDSLFCIFSSTKAITSTAAWLLIEDGRLDTSALVREWIPEFAENGKEEVTLEQLFTHTAGFPSAPFPPLAWEDLPQRLARFKRWRLNWPAGSRFEYHPSSSMYVIADIIEKITQQDWREFVHQKIITPLGMDAFYLNLPDQKNASVLPCEYVGDYLTSQDYLNLGVPVPPVTEVTEDAVLSFNRPEIRAVGIPAGGGICNASSLALFYQALLHDGDMSDYQATHPRIWQTDTVSMGLQMRTGDKVDPLYGKPANRGLGLEMSGDKSRTYRGFGQTNSSDAFGHSGAGGQIAWADPATGLSFVYLTSGHDRNSIRKARRSVSLSNLAAVCAPVAS